MKRINYLTMAAAFWTAFLSAPKAKAQNYDSLKTVEVANDLEGKGFRNLNGYILGKPFQLQVDYNGNSAVVNCPVVGQRQDNDTLMQYPFFVIFNKSDSTSLADANSINGFGAYAIVLNDNKISPLTYVDSIAKVLKGTPDAVVETPRKKNLESRLLGIYPNPTNGEINVNYNLLPNLRSVRFTVYNILGQEVYQKDGKGEGVENLDLNGLPSGTYFLRMTPSDDIEKFMILK